ncbi:MAG: diguanylate cyclase [Clostridia bacterium]|nr:diguanylate cyclase [Clostridia bacterium]
MCDSTKQQNHKQPAFESYNSILQGIHVINTILDNSHDTIYFKDKQSRFLLVSKAQAMGFGVDGPHQVIGKSDFDFFPEAFAQEAYLDEQKIIETGVSLIGKVEKLVWPDGNITWVTVCKYPLYDLEGNIIGTWGNSTDITELKLAKEELERVNLQLKEANRILEILSAVDSLSGLYNHRLYFEEAQKEYRSIQGGYGSPFSIILIDVDHFKSINDCNGHLCGDYAIKYVSEQIRSCIRISDKAFRYGGDEFIVLLPGTNKEQAHHIAEKLRNSIQKTTVKFNSVETVITISSGVAASAEAGNENDLLILADQRLYRSKSEGRNRVTKD